MSSAPASTALHELARLHRVEIAYDGFDGKKHVASDDALIAVLRGLGVPIERVDDAPVALAWKRAHLANRELEPVAVAWHGEPASIEYGVDRARAGDRVRIAIRLEAGGERNFDIALESCAATPLDPHATRPRVALAIGLPADLPVGYHRLALEHGSERHEALVIVAPKRALLPEGRFWGTFLPLYSLHSQDGPGWGDTTALVRLIEWVEGKGGSLVGTTPLLAAFLDDDPFVPSPYAPASRLFWNEFFLDETALPEFATCDRARALAASPEAQAERAALRGSERVEYRRSMAHRRRVLELLADHLFATESPRRRAFEAYLAQHGALDRYARFRAVTERQKKGWRGWEPRLRDGEVHASDFDERVYRYQLYAQWTIDEQIAHVGRKAAEHGLGLYIDFPVGVHPDSFDVWAYRGLFAEGAALGAPPDALFAGGQDWDFPPLIPEAQRQEGYRYLIACLRHHLRHAGVLRVDHVMALHRLYWIPRGTSPKEGVYVRYPERELHAIFCLESHREQAILLGEDLGTVPDEVRRAMSEHGMLRTHVAQFAFREDERHGLEPPPADAVTSLNTHDTPTFAGFWAEDDLDTFAEIGCLPPEQVAAQRKGRARLRETLPRYLAARGRLDASTEPIPADAIAHAVHLELALSDARVLMVNLEDLWGETAPQNIPGTGFERPNWRRRARYALEEFAAMRIVNERLAAIDAARRAPRDEDDTP